MINKYFLRTLLLCLTVFCLMASSGLSTTWVTETVDSDGDVGEYTSIALDSSDNVHISYFDGSNADLKYATNKSGSWVTETVDSYGGVGTYTSIAIDSSDNVHISYHDGGSSADLKYATNKSGSWVTDTVDTGGQVGFDSSIAIDSSGNVHISYLDYTNKDSKYATNASGTWVTDTVDSIGTVSYGQRVKNYYNPYGILICSIRFSFADWYNSIAIDSSDNVHISYLDGSNTDLKYTTKPVDYDPPTVSSTTPANNATGVAVNTSIIATFSEAMDSSTITTDTFFVSSSGNIAGTVVHSGTTATFTPTTALDYNKTYTATITTGAKDVAGNALEADYTWSFTTDSESDTTPPTVSSTNPANNATGVAVNTAITATFSEEMDPSTITTDTFQVSGSGNIAGTVTYTDTTATFRPATDFDFNTTYTATITTGAKDVAGNALEADYTWSFTTQSETEGGDSPGCFIAVINGN